MKDNQRMLSDKEVKRLADFFSLLIQIDRRINKKQSNHQTLKNYPNRATDLHSV